MLNGGLAWLIGLPSLIIIILWLTGYLRRRARSGARAGSRAGQPTHLARPRVVIRAEPTTDELAARALPAPFFGIQSQRGSDRRFDQHYKANRG